MKSKKKKKERDETAIRRRAQEYLFYQPIVIDDFFKYLSCIKMKNKHKDEMDEFLLMLMAYKLDLIDDINDGRLNPEDYLDLKTFERRHCRT